MNQKPETTTYILDVDHRHSPVYVAGLVERNPESVMQTPLVLGMPGSLDYPADAPFHCKSFKLDLNIEDCTIRLIVPDEMATQAEITGLARHFMIPFPGTFLESTALTRGTIQKNNPYAVLVLKLLETVEFLLSSDGVRFCWVGHLEGETLPEADWVRRVNGKMEELEVRPGDKLAKKNIMQLYSAGDAVTTFFDGLLLGDEPLIADDTDSIQMLIKTRTDPAGGDDTHELLGPTIAKSELWWDIIPLVEADFGFDAETRVLFREEQMFDKQSDIGCINMHFKINDPRIDLRSGFRRLWQQAQLCRKNNKVEAVRDLKDIGLKPGEANALRYAISPRNFIEALSVITCSPELSKRPDLEEPGVHIWDHGPRSFDICSMLAVVPQLNGEPPIWNTTFNYPAYATGSPDGKVEDLFRTRNQGRLDEFHAYFMYASETEYQPVQETHRVFVFPVPSRVVKIPSGRIHPVILSNCLLPCFTTGSKHVRNVPNKEYGAGFDKKLQRLMVPEVTEIGLMELAGGLDQLRLNNWRTHENPAAASFIVDQIRLEKFDATFMQTDIKYTMVPGKPTPLQLTEVVLQTLSNDLESENPCMPSAQRAIYNWVKQNRRKDEDFTLFPDVYNEDIGFEFYEKLSVASNFKANLFKILDELYSVHQNHKYVLHVCTLLFLSTRMQFGDKLFTLFTGPPEVSKSYIFKLICDYFAIPGTMEEVGSQSKQTVNSGSQDPGMMTFHDDMSGSTSSIFTMTLKETDSDAAQKKMLSTSCSMRKVVSTEKGERKEQSIFTDGRGSEAGNTNNTKRDMLDSFQSRIMVFECNRIARGVEINQLDLKKAAIYPGQKAHKARAKFEFMLKAQQSFVCLVLQAIRAGALAFDIEKNEEFAKNVHGRFKDSLKAHLGADNVTLSLRMENGQLIPIMMGKMLERLYAACVSGVFGANSPLSIGAKFNFSEMITELAQTSVLQFDVSDYIEAISYFNASLSQETTHVIIKAIRDKIKSKTSTGGQVSSAIVFGETPMNGERGNIGHQPFANNHLAKDAWLSHPEIFFNEYQPNNRHQRNFNWVDLGSLLGISGLTALGMPSRQLLRSLSSALQDVIGASFDFNLILHELGHWEEALTQQVVITETTPFNAQAPMLQEGVQFDYNVLKFHYQMHDSGRSATWHILLNAKWLHEKAGNLRPGKTALVSPACKKFLASAVEIALQYLPFKCAQECTYLLPGMTFDRPASSKNFPMPHIAKTLKMFDPTKNQPFMRSLNKKKLKPYLFIAINPDDGKRLGYSGGAELGIPAMYDYYSTFMHIQIVKSRIENMGVFDPARRCYVREKAELNQVFRGWLRDEQYRYCPAGIEILFNAIREAHSVRNQRTLRDYVSCMVEAEERMTKASLKKHLHPTSASRLLGMDIDGDDEMATEFDQQQRGGGDAEEETEMMQEEEQGREGEQWEGGDQEEMPEENYEEDNSVGGGGGGEMERDEEQRHTPERVVVEAAPRHPPPRVVAAPGRKRPLTAREKVDLAYQRVAEEDDDNSFMRPAAERESEPDESDILSSGQDEEDDDSEIDDRTTKRRRMPLIEEEASDDDDDDQ